MTTKRKISRAPKRKPPSKANDKPAAKRTKGKRLEIAPFNDADTNLTNLCHVANTAAARALDRRDEHYALLLATARILYAAAHAELRVYERDLDPSMRLAPHHVGVTPALRKLEKAAEKYLADHPEFDMGNDLPPRASRGRSMQVARIQKLRATVKTILRNPRYTAGGAAFGMLSSAAALGLRRTDRPDPTPLAIWLETNAAAGLTFTLVERTLLQVLECAGWPPDEASNATREQSGKPDPLSRAD